MTLFRSRAGEVATAEDLGGGLIELTSPISWSRFEQISRNAAVVQMSSALTEEEHRRLGRWFATHPGVAFRVYGNYDQSIRNLDFLGHYPILQDFRVDTMADYDQPILENVDGLDELPLGLQRLSIGVRLPVGAPLERLARLQSLESVTLAAQRTIPDFLSSLPRLREVYIEGPVRSLDQLADLVQMRDLTLRSVTAPDLRPLTHLHGLRSLDLKLGGLRDLTLLPDVGELRYLALWMIRGLTDITSISALPHLQKLHLQSLQQVRTLPDLSRCVALTHVHLETMKGLTELESLGTAPNLEELWLVDAGNLQPEVLLPLVGHPTLRSADLGFGSLRKNVRARELLPLPEIVDTGQFSRVYSPDA